MSEQNDTKKDDNRRMTIEERFDSVSEIIRQMEEGQSLEESFKSYESGLRILKECVEELDNIEQRISLLKEDGTLSRFDENNSKERV